MQQGLVVADDLRQSDQALVVIVGTRNRNVEKFGGSERGGLLRFGRLDAIGVSHHVHFFADFLNVIQREGKFGGAGGHLNGLPAQNEEVLLLHLHGVFAGSEIFDGKVAGVVGQPRNFGLPQTFKFYLNPRNRLSVLIQHPAAQGKWSVGGSKTPSEQERHRCSRNSQTMEHREPFLSAEAKPPLLRFEVRDQHIIWLARIDRKSGSSTTALKSATCACPSRPSSLPQRPGPPPIARSVRGTAKR